MKMIDSSDPTQIEEERKGIKWKDLIERKYEIFGAILFCYFITHLKEIRAFCFSTYYELSESWPVILGLNFYI